MPDPSAAKPTIVEALGLIGLGAAALSLYLATPPLEPEKLLLLPLFGWVVVSDTRTMTIPDICNVSIAIAGVFAVMIRAPDEMALRLFAGAATVAALFAIQTGHRRLRGHVGLGWGDIKLFGACAIWSGPEGIAPTVLIAASLALLFVIFRKIRTGSNLNAALPFGPFIVIGAWSFIAFQG